MILQLKRVRSTPFAWVTVITSLVFIVGVTLFPFQFSWDNNSSPDNSFGQARLGPWRVSDFVLNVLFFMPLGCGICMLMNGPRARRYSVGATVLSVTFAAFFLSLSIETAQAFLPNRNSTWNDVGANTIGAAAGSIFCLLASLKPRKAGQLPKE